MAAPHFYRNQSALSRPASAKANTAGKPLDRRRRPVLESTQVAVFPQRRAPATILLIRPSSPSQQAQDSYGFVRMPHEDLFCT